VLGPAFTASPTRSDRVADKNQIDFSLHFCHVVIDSFALSIPPCLTIRFGCDGGGAFQFGGMGGEACVSCKSDDSEKSLEWFHGWFVMGSKKNQFENTPHKAKTRASEKAKSVNKVFVN
jgi:hypothetical protein